jgi:hypothetical protein
MKSNAVVVIPAFWIKSGQGLEFHIGNVRQENVGNQCHKLWRMASRQSGAVCILQNENNAQCNLEKYSSPVSFPKKNYDNFKIRA